MATFRLLKWVLGRPVPLRDEDLVPTNNLGTGTANSTSYLAGDQTWKQASSLPISSATQSALDLKYDASNPNGYETPTQLNERDTANRNRANHTGTQLAATISDFSSAAQSAVQPSLDNKVYSINVLTTQFSPTSGQTVYAGYYPALTPSTLAGSRRMIIPKSGTIIGVAINFFTNGTVGTAESLAMSIRLSDGTVTAVTSVALANAHRVFFSNSLNIPITANGTNYFEVQFTYPTWATPPTNVHIGGSVLVRS